MRTVTLCMVLVALMPVVGLGQPRDQAAQNEAAIRQYLEHLNNAEAQAAADGWTEHAKNFGREAGREKIRLILEDILVTFPDWHMEIQEIVSQGDVVVVRCKVSGTHRGVAKLAVNGGMLVGVQPTGKHFEVSHIHWHRLRDGKISEHYATRDDLGMMQQLGLVPTRLTAAGASLQ